MTSTSNQVAEYKGRKYRLVWQGQTKFGRRAKIQFFDGSKEFWVNADSIRVTESSSAPRSYGFRRRRDDVCFTCRGIHDGGTICPDCGQED